MKRIFLSFFSGTLLLTTSVCSPDLQIDPEPERDGDIDSSDSHDSDPPPDGDVIEDSGNHDTSPDVEDDGICTDVIDLVFVLDVSSSMSFVLSRLQSEIGSVVNASNELADESHFGLVAYVDNHAIDNTGDLEGGLVHTTAGTLQQAFQFYRENYTEPNRNPGDGLSGPTTQNPICEENALDALYDAATLFPWRDNATRLIIVATDDTFIEYDDNYGDRDGDGDWDLTDFPREGNYPALRTYAETVEKLQEANVRVFTFTRLVPPNVLTRCGTPRRLPWADIVDGWTQPYNGQPPIPEATDAQNFAIGDVQASVISLTTTINNVVLDSYCHEPIY